MAGQQAAAADAELGVPRGCRHAIDELDAWPYPAGILPAAPGTTEPLAQDGACGHQTALLFVQSAGERSHLAGSAHAGGDQAGQQTGGDRESRTFRNPVDLASSEERR